MQAETQRKWRRSMRYLFLLALELLLLLGISGRAARHHQRHDPRPIHLGLEHLQCDGFNHCEMVRDWLTPDNKPVLSPTGCVLAKSRITWIFGDRPSMCKDKGSKPPKENK